MLSIRSVHRKLHSTSNRIFYPHGLAQFATSSKSKRRRIPDLIIVDEHRMKNPHLRKCIHCFKPIRTQNMKAHVEKHKRKGEKPRPDEARRQFDESLANAKQYIQKNKAAFSNLQRKVRLNLQRKVRRTHTSINSKYSSYILKRVQQWKHNNNVDNVQTLRAFNLIVRVDSNFKVWRDIIFQI